MSEPGAISTELRPPSAPWTPPPTDRIRVSLRDGVTLSAADGPDLAFGWKWGRVVISSPPGRLREALLRLGGGGATRGELIDLVVSDGGPLVGRLLYHLNDLDARGTLSKSATDGERRLASLRPLGEAGSPCPRHRIGDSLTMSRTGCRALRSCERAMVN
jgi:hypothetical protein